MNVCKSKNFHSINEWINGNGVGVKCSICFFPRRFFYSEKSFLRRKCTFITFMFVLSVVTYNPFCGFMFHVSLGLLFWSIFLRCKLFAIFFHIHLIAHKVTKKKRHYFSLFLYFRVNVLLAGANMKNVCAHLNEFYIIVSNNYHLVSHVWKSH